MKRKFDQQVLTRTVGTGGRGQGGRLLHYIFDYPETSRNLRKGFRIFLLIKHPPDFQTFLRHCIDTYKLQNSAYQRPHTQPCTRHFVFISQENSELILLTYLYFILLGHPNKSFRNWWILHCPYIQSDSAISTDWMVKVLQVWENNYSTRVGPDQSSDSKIKKAVCVTPKKASVGALNWTVEYILTKIVYKKLFLMGGTVAKFHENILVLVCVERSFVDEIWFMEVLVHISIKKFHFKR